MAKRINEKVGKVDKLISSTATRALETALFFAEELEIKKKHIVQMDQLYLAAPEAFAKVVTALDDEDKTVCIFSHNPGITLFANQLTPIKIDDMPTCAVYAVRIDTKKWSEFATANKEFWFFDYPKNPFA